MLLPRCCIVFLFLGFLFLPDLSTRSSRGSQYHVSFSGHAGTSLYMSPEQTEHSRCTEKVDIYSLGVIYFEMNYVFATSHEKEKVTYMYSGIDLYKFMGMYIFGTIFQRVRLFSGCD